MLHGNVVLDLQSSPGDFGVTLKPFGSRDKSVLIFEFVCWLEAMNSCSLEEILA
jgi:hypothetical protein